MRPLIGITSWRRRLDTFYGPETLQTLSTFYTDSVSRAGMVPVMLPAGLDPEDAPRLVSLVDGVLISGGDDVDPASYETANKGSKNVDQGVDRFEIAVTRAAQDDRTPVLAICRGLQLLNVALGGTLIQEVAAQGGVHLPVTRDHEEMQARRHAIRFEDGSVLAAMYADSEVEVNTLHHQGLDRVAADLIVEGRSDDGLVEAARFAGDWWALGVQWHPERLDGDHQRIFAELRKAIEAR